MLLCELVKFEIKSDKIVCCEEWPGPKEIKVWPTSTRHIKHKSLSTYLIDIASWHEPLVADVQSHVISNKKNKTINDLLYNQKNKWLTVRILKS